MLYDFYPSINIPMRLQGTYFISKLSGNLC